MGPHATTSAVHAAAYLVRFRVRARVRVRGRGRVRVGVRVRVRGRITAAHPRR